MANEVKVLDRAKDSDIHDDWALKALDAGVARKVTTKGNGEDVAVTIKDVPAKGDKVLIPFNALTFTGIESLEDWSKLWTLVEANKGTVKVDGNEVPVANPLPKLLDYAYGLQRRSAIRVAYESGFVDLEAADKKLAATLIKQGRAKTEAQAMKIIALLKSMEEDTEDE